MCFLTAGKTENYVETNSRDIRNREVSISGVSFGIRNKIVHTCMIPACFLRWRKRWLAQNKTKVKTSESVLDLLKCFSLSSSVNKVLDLVFQRLRRMPQRPLFVIIISVWSSHFRMVFSTSLSLRHKNGYWFMYELILKKKLSTRRSYFVLFYLW